MREMMPVSHFTDREGRDNFHPHTNQSPSLKVDAIAQEIEIYLVTKKEVRTRERVREINGNRWYSSVPRNKFSRGLNAKLYRPVFTARHFSLPRFSSFSAIAEDSK